MSLRFVVLDKDICLDVWGSVFELHLILTNDHWLQFISLICHRETLSFVFLCRAYLCLQNLVFMLTDKHNNESLVGQMTTVNADHVCFGKNNFQLGYSGDTSS